MADRTDFMEESARHYELVGRFVTTFASAEAAVHVLARKLSGLSDEIARVIFGGMRLGDVTDRVRGIMRINKVAAETYAVVDACLVQLNHISDRRHRLVHRTSIFQDGDLIVTDILTSRSSATAEMQQVGQRELKDMIMDCVHINLKLSAIADPAEALETFEPAVQEVLQSPWQYKHVPPKPPNQQPRKASGSQKRQLGASEA
jgi:hypothetical protein